MRRGEDSVHRDEGSVHWGEDSVHRGEDTVVIENKSICTVEKEE